MLESRARPSRNSRSARLRSVMSRAIDEIAIIRVGARGGRSRVADAGHAGLAKPRMRSALRFTAALERARAAPAQPGTTREVMPPTRRRRADWGGVSASKYSVRRRKFPHDAGSK